MDYINHNTTLRTNKHLNLEERFYVEKRMTTGDSVTAIATVLGPSRTTIYTELNRGSVVQIRQGKARLVYLHIMKWFVLKLYITIFIKDYFG